MHHELLCRGGVPGAGVGQWRSFGTHSWHISPWLWPDSGGRHPYPSMWLPLNLEQLWSRTKRLFQNLSLCGAFWHYIFNDKSFSLTVEGWLLYQQSSVSPLFKTAKFLMALRPMGTCRFLLGYISRANRFAPSSIFIGFVLTYILVVFIDG